MSVILIERVFPFHQREGILASASQALAVFLISFYGPSMTRRYRAVSLSKPRISHGEHGTGEAIKRMPGSLRWPEDYGAAFYCGNYGGGNLLRAQVEPSVSLSSSRGVFLFIARSLSSSCHRSRSGAASQ